MIRCLNSLLIIVLLSSCSPRPEPLPAPLPTAEAVQEAAPEFVAWLPVVGSGGEPIQGYARAYAPISPAQARALRIDWYYTYALPHSRLGAAQFVPMFWCDQYPANKWPTQVDYFDVFRQHYGPDYSSFMLFLNEPDLAGGDVDGGQCDRTPRQAAYIYKALLAECPHCIFIGPATSHIDYLRGWPWLKAWYAEIRRMGLRPPDIAAIHDYTSQHPGLIVDSLFEALAQFPDAPTTAWVTEYGTCDPARLAQAMAYFTADPRVARYAWFTAKGYPNQPCLNLLDGSDGLTAVGEVYSGQAAYP